MTDRSPLSKRRGAVILGLLHVLALAACTGIGLWNSISQDLSNMPLGVVSMSQTSLLALWVVIGSGSLHMRALLSIAFLLIVSVLRWLVDGLPIPMNSFWLSTYLLDGGIPFVTVLGVCYLSGARRSCRLLRQHCQRSYRFRFSVLDLLLFTLATSIILAAVLTHPAKQSEFQYVYDIQGSLRTWAVLSMGCIIATLVGLRTYLASTYRFRSLLAFLTLSVVGGVVAARTFEVNSNPLWTWYVFGPFATATLIVITLMALRRAELRAALEQPLLIAKRVPVTDKPENDALHRSDVRQLHFIGRVSIFSNCATNSS